MEDLVLVLDDGKEQTRIPTCHQVMANASPYFRAMLRADNFSEGQTLHSEKHLELSLPETDIKAMSVLCDIFHLRTDKITIMDINPDLLCEIATLVDRYDCAKAIQPWPRSWFKDPKIQKIIDEPGQLDLSEVAKWVHISSQLGHSELFALLTKRLIMETGDKDWTSDQSGFAGQMGKVSTTIQEAIEKKRESLIIQFHSLIHDLVTDLEAGTGCFLRTSSYGTLIYEPPLALFDCSSVVLGNTLIATREEFGANWRDVNSWTCSVAELRERMRRVAEKLTGPERIAFNKNLHGACSRRAFVLSRLEFMFAGTTGGIGLQLRDLGNSFYRKAPWMVDDEMLAFKGSRK